MKFQRYAKGYLFLLIGVHIFILVSCGTAQPRQEPASTPTAASETVCAGEKSKTAPLPDSGKTADGDYKDNIIISELCAKNKAGIRDGTGAFSDWIEISNLSGKSVLLADVYITDDPENPKKYKIPERTLEAGGCLLIFASGGVPLRDGEIHAPFKLSAEGETIALYAEEAGLIDSVTYDCLKAGRSLYKNHPGEPMRETCYTTPGYPNTDAGYEAYCNACNAAGPIQINEPLLPQSDGKCYDWVEIKNISSRPVRLNDYYITDKPEQREYTFPDTVLQPGEYFILICSGSEKTDASGYRHAGFSLNAESESLYLYKKQNQELIDWVWIEAVPCGASFGRQEQYGGFFYFTAPSPGRRNSGGVRKVCEEPQATLPEGVYETGGLTVALEASGTIYYTTDGSEPDRSAPKYTGPLLLSKSTVLRAIVYQDGKLPSRIKTCSYLLHSDTTLPVLSLVTKSDNLWSEETGIYVKGKYDNYYQDWERAASLAYFENGSGFALDCGLKMNGSGSRESDAKKSFKVNFRGKYGKSELEYDLFGNGVTSFDSLVLRAGEDYPSSIFRNELFTTFAGRYVPSLLVQTGKYCSLYINGEYFGIYYLQERLNEKYYAEHFGVPEDSVSVSEYKPDEGSDLDQILGFCSSRDLTEPENYRYVQSKIDIESMTDWFILEAYSGNTDVIQNVRYMKSDADGGKWKWAFYDLDWAFYFHKNAFEDLLTENLRETNQIIRPLLKNSEYRVYFLERLAYQIKNTLQNEKILAVIEEYERLLEPEIDRERALWGGSRSGWEQSVAELKAYITEQDRCGELIESITNVLRLTDQEVRKYFG